MPATGHLFEVGQYLRLPSQVARDAGAVLLALEQAIGAGRFVLLRHQETGPCLEGSRSKSPLQSEESEPTVPRGEDLGAFTVRFEVRDPREWVGTKLRLLGEGGRDLGEWDIVPPSKADTSVLAFVFTELRTDAKYSLELTEVGASPRYLFKDLMFADLPSAEWSPQLPPEEE